MMQKTRGTLHAMTATAAVLIALAVAGCGDVGDAPRAETGDSVATTPAPSAGDAASTTVTGVQTLPIDTSASRVTWKAAKVTRAHDGGFRALDGTVTVDGSNVTGATIRIDARTIYADDEKLTGHLRSPDFFDVEKYPDARFEATSFAPDTAGGGTHRVTGNLTMRDSTKSVTFPATISVENGTVKAKADFIIDRKQWGIVYPGAPDDLINDEVRIIFDITAHQ